MKKTALLVTISAVLAGCGRDPEQPGLRTRYERGRTDNFSAAELRLEKALKDAARLPAAADFASGMFASAYIIPEEHPGIGFTVRQKDGAVEVERGLDTAVEPTLVIPLSDEGIMNAYSFFKDGKLDETEEFLVANALFKPGWEASYRIPELRSRLVSRYMKLDGLLHAVLLNPGGVRFKGRPVKNELSVARVSGQWVIFSGLEGTPDARMELSPKDAMEMYALIMRDLPRAETFGQKREVMRKFSEVRARCLKN
ncbi:MAG: hypothetical protein FD189_318 [Elusimicrobia bacterium]|nr:MAG: hypothetical protein FD154_118 [Elusimicrobiota bacterium]KAF0158051.1 MAG: hypothetical protein FD189_318 [Elusimicrobiota bacterium]